jgi:excisionase family DNA binding protein
MLSTHDVASLCGLSYHAVLGAIHAGELRASKLRGRILVRQEWLDAWIDASVLPPTQLLAVTPARARTRKPSSRTTTMRGSLAALRAIEDEH